MRKAANPVETADLARSAQRGLTMWLRHGATLFVAVIREIFDESAYSRFLERTKMASSQAAYAAFRHEHEMVKARRPRCC